MRKSKYILSFAFYIIIIIIVSGGEPSSEGNVQFVSISFVSKSFLFILLYFILVCVVDSDNIPMNKVQQLGEWFLLDT